MNIGKNSWDVEEYEVNECTKLQKENVMLKGCK